jgi:hypothetical protein
MPRPRPGLSLTGMLRTGASATRTYLVECFSPRMGRQEALLAGDRAEVAAAELGGAGAPIAYLGALLVERDEVVFHLFRAADADLVRAAAARAGFVFERVVESTVIDRSRQRRSRRSAG